MILGDWRADELEPQKVSVGLRLGPDDLRVLDGLVVGRRADSQRADLTYGDAGICRDAKASDARIDGQPGALHRPQQVDFGIECPPTGLPARTPVNRGIGAALGEHRRESFGNGHDDRLDHIEVDDP